MKGKALTSPTSYNGQKLGNRKGSKWAVPTLYNIEESDIDTLYKSRLSLFVSSCWLAEL